MFEVFWRGGFRVVAVRLRRTPVTLLTTFEPGK
jgi:hypothetical protein